MKRNPIEVIGTIESDHNWLTIVYLSEVTHITAPVYYLGSLEVAEIPFEIIRINELNGDRCWSCGKPVEPGHRFCNEECKKGVPQPSLN